MSFFYSLGISVYGFFIAIASLFNPKARLLRKGQSEALALLRQQIEPGADYVWFHAASLGEFEQGRPVMEQLKREQPETKILLTFFSPSGYEVRKNYAGADVIVYLPLDTRRNAHRFISIATPSRAVFIKYEFWANYLIELRKQRIPACCISAIFRPDQVFFAWYGAWYRGLLTCFTHLFVQDQSSADLLARYGIGNVTVCGDTRFDRVYEVRKQAKPILLVEQFIKDKQVIVAGSSWGKDEELLVRYAATHTDLKLILVPHEIHQGHLNEIARITDNQCVYYTKADEQTVENAACLVVDTIGLLSSIYQYATVAYIGGGFGVGIHNTLEAAVYGIPVVFGPNYQRFREARELIVAGGAFAVADYETLNLTLDKLLSASTVSGNIAGDYVMHNLGATAQICTWLKQPDIL